jgi:hypothetical protein
MKIVVRSVPGSRHLAVLVVAAVLGMLTISTVRAQGFGLPGSTEDQMGKRFRQSAPEKPAPAPAEAIPGAKAREPAAPQTRPVGDMQPTDALFDAINRGDIVAARDALNRGADLNGINILGMTPMELSVDLGRNDISFLLLSMRGDDSSRGTQLVGRDNPSGRDRGPPAPAAKIARVVKPSGPAKPAQVATRPLATPKLFANDGGTPLPSAGFLGFDPRSAEN